MAQFFTGLLSGFVCSLPHTYSSTGSAESLTKILKRHLSTLIGLLRSHDKSASLFFSLDSGGNYSLERM